MTNNNLIPFSKELWETGEYEAETKSKWIPVIHEITSTHIYGRIDEYQFSWDLNGGCIEESSDHNLMLRKKTKKKWTAIINSDLYDTEQECIDYWAYWAESGDFIKAIEVEI